MTIVDAEGRLFGRWNFVDVVVVVLLLAIGPLGYAAFVLFRSPDPRIVSIEPAEVLEGPNQRVVIRGTNLRPYMRLSFNNVQGRTFLFQDSTRAEVDLNEMPPGKYDVVLYDFGQERHRLAQALTVKPNSSLVPAATKVACFVKLSGGMPECGRSDFTLRPIYVLTIPTSGTTALSFQIDQV